MNEFLSRTITCLVAFIFISSAFSQSKYPGWDIFTSMKNVQETGISGSKIWAATSGGMFSFDLNSFSVSVTYKSLDGLLSNELSALSVDNSGNIWSGSVDGGLHRFNPALNSFLVSNDILTSTEPVKKINSFYEYSNFMFIATEFSVIRFNKNTFQFIDQPYIYLGSLPVKTPVYDVIVVNDTIWAATKNGIAFANINNYLPISSNWSNFTTANSVLKKNQVNAAAFFNGNIFFGTDSGFVFYSGGTLNIFEPSYNGTPIRDKIYRIAVSGNILYFLTAIQSNNIYSVNTSNLTQANLVYQNANANSILITSSGELLIGTGDRGVNIFRNNTDNYVMPNGPLSNTAIFAETDAQKNVWFVSGGTNEGISKFDGKTWKGYSVQQYPWMQGNDFRQIYASDYNGKVYASGYGPGMLQIDGDSLLLFTDQNSCIRPFTPGFTLVEGIKEDNSGNLWIVNRAADNGKPILNFSSCQSYYVPENQSATTLIFLAIDNYGTKWMTFPNDLPSGERGICYYNESANAGGIIRAVELGSDINNANNIIVENNGEVWIGTDNGVVIIPDPYQVISNPNSLPYMFKMRIIENGISTPLTENVQCLQADALNNKWLGTQSNGLLYVSPDGSTLLNRFNTSNSPLPENRIYTIACDRKNGIAYFGTAKGLLSYKTIAIEPLSECDKISVMPNPYIVPDGNLRIDGMVAESTVKILTLNGTLVNEFITPGGRVVMWDGKDNNGNYISSGIYIIVGYDKDGKNVCTGKVAVVRK